jgi:hypothetical protein
VENKELQKIASWIDPTMKLCSMGGAIMVNNDLDKFV